MNGLLETALSIAGGILAGGVTLGVVLRMVMQKGLDVLAKSHEQRMEHAHRERMAAASAHQQRELEMFKTELANLAHETRKRSEVLITRQGEAIAEIYRRMLVAQFKLDANVRPNECGAEVEDEITQPTIEAVWDFIHYFEAHKIFLNEGTAELLEAISESFQDAMENYEDALGVERSKAADPGEYIGLYDRAGQIMGEQVPAARTELERNFRDLLGIATGASVATKELEDAT